MHKKNDHNLRTLLTRLFVSQRIVIYKSDELLFSGNVEQLQKTDLTDLFGCYVGHIWTHETDPGILKIDVY